MDFINDFEFTLQDTYDLLKETKQEYKEKIETLIDRIKKNKIAGINPDITSEDIAEKQNTYVNNLIKEVENDLPKDYPILYSQDMDENLISHLDNEIESLKYLKDNILKDINEYNKDIHRLRKKKEELQIMEENNQTKEVINYKRTLKNINKEFRVAKEDLAEVVDVIFPNNKSFEYLLGDLTSSFTRGGEDVYVEVKEEYVAIINFLIEEYLIAYHPYNKNLIKLMNLI